VLWQQDFIQTDFTRPEMQSAIWASIGLGIVGSAVATALFYLLVQKAGGLFASLVTYGIPFIALFWGFIYGEKVTVVEIACLGVILCGVFLANLKPRRSD
jgi:drug/metabolite transporter (DMT)-like permease